MKHLTFLLTVLITIGSLYADVRDVVEPKVQDKLERVTLNSKELGGEMARRMDLLIYKNYMVLDMDKSWLDKFQKRTDRNGKEWVYYGIGKVFDAGSLFAQYTGDPKVAERTQYLIDGLRASRDPDGYVGFWNVEPGNMQDYANWILHEQEYINLGLVRNYRTTGNPKSLEDAKIMGDYIIKTFPTEENGFYNPSRICTAGLPEGFLELYRVTGDKRYLDFAANVKHGNSGGEVCTASLKTWKQGFKKPPCHVYVMLARIYSQTELYRYDGSDSLMFMSRFMKNEMFEKGRGAFLITGSSSQGEHMTYNQNGQGAIQESCVTAYMLRWFDSLLRLEGNLTYGDLMERTIFNALFAAMSPNGRQICYFTPFTGQRGFQGGDTFCCNGNYRRAVAEIPQKVYYRFDDGGIALNLFTQSEKTFGVNGKSVTIKQETNYPNSGEVKLTFTADTPVQFPFRFRTPRWADKISCSVNGVNVPVVRSEMNYMEIKREWKTGDVVAISMPMDWRLIRGREVQDGRFALMRGPILFGFSTRLNPELSKTVANGRELYIDPTTIDQPELDDYVRPDGQKVSVKAWTSPDCKGEKVDVVLGEYVDDKCVSVYSKLAGDLSACPVRIMDDELLSEPRKTQNLQILNAYYGEADSDAFSSAFAKPENCLADLAADYVPPAGKKDVKAEFPDKAGNGTWTLWLKNGNSATQLNSSAKTFGCPVGYAYGLMNRDLGFFANYAPCENMDEGWLGAYTRDMFDKALEPNCRTNFLYSHPVADPNSFVVARWTPSKPIDARCLGAAGTLLGRKSGDGVQLKIQAQKKDADFANEYVFSSNDGKAKGPARAVDYAARFADGNKIAYIDFMIGNNGSHTCDSTALNAKVYRVDQPFLQTDVTEKVQNLIGGKFRAEIGSYKEQFGDPCPGKAKTLRITVRNDDTGAVSVRTFADDAPIEL